MKIHWFSLQLSFSSKPVFSTFRNAGGIYLLKVNSRNTSKGVKAVQS